MSKIKIKNDDRLVPESIDNGNIEDLVIVSNTEPTGKKRRMIWIKEDTIYKLVNNVYKEVLSTSETSYTSGKLRVYKNGRIVNIVASQMPVADLLQITLPADCNPPHQVMNLIIYQTPGWSTLLGRVLIPTTGVMQISKASALPAVFENATDGYVSFSITYLR